MHNVEARRKTSPGAGRKVSHRCGGAGCGLQRARRSLCCLPKTAVRARRFRARICAWKVLVSAIALVVTTWALLKLHDIVHYLEGIHECLEAVARENRRAVDGRLIPISLLEVEAGMVV